MKLLKRAGTAAVALALVADAALAQSSPPRGVGVGTVRESKVRLPDLPTRTATIALGSEEHVVEYDIIIKLTSVQTGQAATLEVLYRGAKKYKGFRHAAGNDTHRSDLSRHGESPDLLPAAVVLYRTHRTCDGALQADTAGNGFEIVDLRGYRNYACRSRFHEQCFADGSFDVYYDERCDFAPVRFVLGGAKAAGGFEIRLVKAEAGSATVEVKSTLTERWGPARNAKQADPADRASADTASRPSKRARANIELLPLPPDPGPTGNASVQGVDADGNGVRDDLQRYIVLTYSDAPTRAALAAVAVQMQNLTRPSLSESEAVQFAEQLASGISCLREVSPAQTSTMVRELQSRAANTNDRMRNYMKSNAMLSGNTFSIGAGCR